MLAGILTLEDYGRMLRWFDQAPTRHRAKDDAERLMQALAHGLGRKYGTPVRLALDSK